MNRKYIVFLLLLIVILAISSFFIIKELVDNKKESEIYSNLQNVFIENNNQDTDNSSKVEVDSFNLKTIKSINSDVIGWIRIDGTNIDYPVMQNKDYYLYRNIYKEYSSHGTPYLASHCKLKASTNLIIYGHHMNDNTMFSQLDDYKKYEFYKNHKYIKFYTLDNEITIENTYEIVLVFKTAVYTKDTFKYYNYSNFSNEKEFKEFIDNCRSLSLYETEKFIEYADELITLSTCEYSQKNGRIVVIARKI